MTSYDALRAAKGLRWSLIRIRVSSPCYMDMYLTYNMAGLRISMSTNTAAFAVVVCFCVVLCLIFLIPNVFFVMCTESGEGGYSGYGRGGNNFNDRLCVCACVRACVRACVCVCV